MQYSASVDNFYVDNYKELKKRVAKHLSKFFPGAFSGKASDWVVYLWHVKKMKGKKYIQEVLCGQL